MNKRKKQFNLEWIQIRRASHFIEIMFLTTVLFFNLIGRFGMIGTCGWFQHEKQPWWTQTKLQALFFCNMKISALIHGTQTIHGTQNDHNFESLATISQMLIYWLMVISRSCSFYLYKCLVFWVFNKTDILMYFIKWFVFVQVRQLTPHHTGQQATQSCSQLSLSGHSGQRDPFT